MAGDKLYVAFNVSAQAKADSVPLNEEKRTFGIALKIFYEGDTANSNIETHYQPFNSATNAFHSVAATITPEKPNQVIKTVAFAFVYQYNENVMTLKNAMPYLSTFMSSALSVVSASLSTVARVLVPMAPKLLPLLI